MVRDNFSVSTWLAIGALFQSAAYSLLGRTAFLPAICLLLYRIADAYAIKTGQTPPDLSEQELVDCSQSYGNEGCNGGFMHWAFNYIIDNNVHNQAEYPYKGRGQACQTSKLGKGKFGISKCIRSQPSIEGLVNSIAEAPVAVALYVGFSFMFYRKGIYNPSSCAGEPNHGVLAVGYDKNSNPPSYYVKNSWGPIWGDKGFFYIAHGTGKARGSGRRTTRVRRMPWAPSRRDGGRRRASRFVRAAFERGTPAG